MRISILALLLALAPLAKADENTMLNTPMSGAATPHHGGKNKAANAKKKKNSDPQRLSGVCEILESPSDPFPGPCVTMPIQIVDSTGKVEAVTRSSREGAFEFEIEEGASYSLKAGSSSYETVAPTAPVSAGPKPVAMKIRRKGKTL